MFDTQYKALKDGIANVLSLKRQRKLTGVDCSIMPICSVTPEGELVFFLSAETDSIEILERINALFKRSAKRPSGRPN